MKQVTFTSPGKIGDCLMQWPVAYWWLQENQGPIDFWMDETTCKPLVPLVAAQPGVREVKLVSGVENYHCGGQPWHMNLAGGEHSDRQFMHLGLRAFPQRQLTLQAREDVPFTLKVKPQVFGETPSLVVPEAPKVNRVVLHGTGVCPHNKQTPQFWRFLATIRKDLEKEFDEIVFVGAPNDREIGKATYPDWQEWADDGDFLALATYINGSRLMIGCGSAPIVLAGLLKVPGIRVHDEIGKAPRVLWSNLGSNQMNATELDLRTEWHQYRERWLKQEVACPK